MVQTILLYIKRFFQNTYYGGRQWILQYMLIWMASEGAQLLGNEMYFGRFGLEGLIMIHCMLLYTMLYYWFKAFTPRLRPLLHAAIPYIPYALMIYLYIVAKNDWNFKRVTFDDYMLLGLFMPFCCLVVISIEYALKAWMPAKAKRIASIVWNVLTILMMPFFLLALGFATGLLGVFMRYFD